MNDCGVTILCEVLLQSLTACSSLQGASEDRLYWSIGGYHQKRPSFLLEIDYCDSKFCSRWSNGVHEEWKPEILSRRRHISPGPVLRPHSTPSETCLCIIYWFRYAKSFSKPPMLWTLWSLLSFGMELLQHGVFPWCCLALHSRYIGCPLVGHGISLQEVREDIPSWCRFPRLLGHGRWLHPWDLAQHSCMTRLTVVMAITICNSLQ